MSKGAKVYISSESPIKHEAVRRAFARIGLRAHITGFNVASDVSAQPLTIEETYEGARNRHAHLRELVEDMSGYLVTSESGVIKPFPTSPWKGCEVVIIEKRPDEAMMGVDLGVEYPQAMMDKVPSEYPDLGVLLQAEYGFTEKDPPSFLTDGRLSRTDLIEQAVFKVLAQQARGEYES
jgi:non-canonical (house-cleaning) NTP pyrophosphatase